MKKETLILEKRWFSSNWNWTIFQFNDFFSRKSRL